MIQEKSLEVQRPVARRKKMTTYILISYNIERISYKTFLNKGSKIKMVPTTELAFPEVSGSYLAVELFDKNTGEVIVTGQNTMFRFNIKTGKTIKNPINYNVQPICNVKRWRNFTIYFPSDRKVLFMPDKDTNLKPLVSSEMFSDSYCGGYHTYSRNAEIVSDGYLLFIDVSGCVIKYDLKAQLNPKNLKKGDTYHLDREDINHLIENNSKFEPIQGTKIFNGGAETFFVRENFVYVGTNLGGVVMINQPLNQPADKSMLRTTLAVFEGGMVSAMNYFFGNIVASTFESGRAMLHLYNLKHSLSSSLKIGEQRWPAHKIEMFIKHKICFGLCLNRGLSMHVFGIHECKMFIFNESVEVATSHIAGILFLDDTRVLVYGAKNYNMLFRISI